MGEPTCWCGHPRGVHGEPYQLTANRTYCLWCYWKRYPYRAQGREDDIHDFSPVRESVNA